MPNYINASAIASAVTHRLRKGPLSKAIASAVARRLRRGPHVNAVASAVVRRLKGGTRPGIEGRFAEGKLPVGAIASAIAAELAALLSTTSTEKQKHEEAGGPLTEYVEPAQAVEKETVGTRKETGSKATSHKS